MKNGDFVKKMTFRSFDENTYKENKAIAEYTVMMNPASISRTLSTKHSDNDARGAVASDGKWIGLESEVFSFDLIFDCTGLVNPTRTDLELEIENFLKVVYIPDKKDIKQSFVELSFGTTTANCKMSSINIDYQLFNREGEPIRAKISCSFITVAPPKKKSKSAEKPKPKPKPQPQPQPQEPVVSSSTDCHCPPPECCNDVVKRADSTQQNSLYSAYASYQPSDE